MCGRRFSDFVSMSGAAFSAGICFDGGSQKEEFFRRCPSEHFNVFRVVIVAVLVGADGRVLQFGNRTQELSNALPRTNTATSLGSIRRDIISANIISRPQSAPKSKTAYNFNHARHGSRQSGRRRAPQDYALLAEKGPPLRNRVWVPETTWARWGFIRCRYTSAPGVLQR